MDPLILGDDMLRVVVDPGRGADVLSMVVGGGVEMLFSTPWRARADALRAGLAHPMVSDSAAQWMEQYRGGWQTLCPNAGSARLHRSAPYGFHGEAASAVWTVKSASAVSAELSVELFTAPVRIVREVSVDSGRFVQRDRVVNLSRRDIDIDYSSHPAFGPGLLGGGAVIDTDARAFIADHEAAQPAIVPGSAHEWPWLTTASGSRRDLRVLPAAPAPAALFGWLTDFERGRATVTAAVGIAVDLEWDARVLPYAWIWQELEQSDDFPWFGRARVMAIEPASTPTSGPGRARSLEIPAYGEVEIDITMTVRQAADASAHQPDASRDWEST